MGGYSIGMKSIISNIINISIGS